MPSVARPNNEDYLLRTLHSIADQLSADPADLMYGKVLVVVVKLQESEHARYEEAKRHFGSPDYPKSIYFEFQDTPEKDVDPFPELSKTKDRGSPNKPGYVVRKQTRDVVKVMKECFDKARYYLFLEDDMSFCPSGITTIQYLLSKASRYHPNWLAIRASYGMNGNS
jgi:hypothetical protein